MISFIYCLKLNCIFIAIIFLTKICLIKKMYVYLPHKKAIPPCLCRQVAKSQLKPHSVAIFPDGYEWPIIWKNQKSVYRGNYIPCIAVLVSCNCSFIAAKVGRKNGRYKFLAANLRKNREFSQNSFVSVMFNFQISLYAILKKY